jgi:hypothetical protein
MSYEIDVVLGLPVYPVDITSCNLGFRIKNIAAKILKGIFTEFVKLEI